MFDKYTQGKQIVVGSSLGAWLGIKLIQERPDKSQGFVSLAGAPDFTVRKWEQLSKEKKKEMKEKGYIRLDSRYCSEGYVYPYRLFEDAKDHIVFTDKETVELPCESWLLHGLDDLDVDWRVSESVYLKIKEGSESTSQSKSTRGSASCHLRLIEKGDHRLSKDEDLNLLTSIIDDIVNKT